MKTVIGLTGPIGAGKSTVAQRFAERGFYVVDADRVARKIVEKGSAVLPKLANAFGNDILEPDGSLNRKKLATLAFTSKENTQLLNDLTHPAIISEVNNEIESCQQNLVLLDAPQLFESGLNEICDKVIAITAPTGLLIKRIMKRDSIDREMATKRLLSQFSTDFFKEHADIVIENNNDFLKLRIDVEVAIRTIKGYEDSFDL